MSHKNNSTSPVKHKLFSTYDKTIKNNNTFKFQN